MVDGVEACQDRETQHISFLRRETLTSLSLLSAHHSRGDHESPETKLRLQSPSSRKTIPLTVTGNFFQTSAVVSKETGNPNHGQTQMEVFHLEF